MTDSSNKPATIILSGGGNEQQTFELDAFFFEKIKQGGSVLYIPIALRGHEYFNTAANWFLDVVKIHGRENDLEITTIYDLETKFVLDQFDAIYIGGGNTWNLLQEIRDSGYDKMLTEYVQSGKVLYGGSAGAILFGKDISCQHDEKSINIDSAGLNLIGGHSVACHYNLNDDEDIVEWVENNNKIIGIPENGGVILIDGEITQVIGGNSFIFNSDGKEPIRS